MNPKLMIAIKSLFVVAAVWATFLAIGFGALAYLVAVM